MTDRTPESPAPSVTAADDDRLVATTPELVAALEEVLGCRLEEATLEELFVELDLRGYVEWVAVTRSGEYVWDLTDLPDRVADAVAESIAARLDERVSEVVDGS